MEQYRIEGIFINRRGVKRLMKDGIPHPADIEPFTKAFWASNADEAYQEATYALNGGEWIEKPRISVVSEAERMRAIGAPELPGLMAV
ncbi:MAG: hypothetical protein CL609_23545 [Anaerolineaceae bacterium]|nr:hypothetical protein [Anaerolineaceae bacterium]